MKKILHNHLLLNGLAKNPPRDKNVLHAWLTELVHDIGMKIVTGPHVEYVEAQGNRGLTGCVGIETSHIALHIWDEKDPAFVQFDLYTCSTLPVEQVLTEIQEFMGLETYEHLVLNREDGFVNALTQERL